MAPAIRLTCLKRPCWAASSLSGAAGAACGVSVAIAAGDDGGDEGGVAPRQVLCRGLGAGLLIELLGQVAARWSVGPDHFQETVAAGQECARFVGIQLLTLSGPETELSRGQCREVVRPAGVVHIALI